MEHVHLTTTYKNWGGGVKKYLDVVTCGPYFRTITLIIAWILILLETDVWRPPIHCVHSAVNIMVH